MESSQQLKVRENMSLIIFVLIFSSIYLNLVTFSGAEKKFVKMVNKNLTNWNSARKICEEQKMKLAEIHSKDEDDIFHKEVIHNEKQPVDKDGCFREYWIGVTRAKNVADYEWHSSKASLNYSHFAKFQEPLPYRNCLAAIYWAKEDIQWASRKCDEKHCVVCESDKDSGSD